MRWRASGVQVSVALPVNALWSPVDETRGSAGEASSVLPLNWPQTLRPSTPGTIGPPA